MSLQIGFVDFDFECSTVCPTLLGLMGIWLKRLCSWASQWNTEIKFNPTQPRSTRTWDVLYCCNSHFSVSVVAINSAGVSASYSLNHTVQVRYPFSKARQYHSQTAIQTCMWYVEQPSLFSVGQTALSITCSIMEKPHRGLHKCPRMLLSRFRKRMSGSGLAAPWRGD